jgi:hypothetical protein
MAARRHALRKRQSLPFRSADTQRGEYIRDTHFTHTLKKSGGTMITREVMLWQHTDLDPRCPCTNYDFCVLELEKRLSSAFGNLIS